MIFWVMLFFVSGMALVFAEFFLPGLILGTIGFILVIISAILGVYAYPNYAVFIIVGQLIGVAGCVALGFWILTRTRASKLLVQKHSQQAEAGYVSAPSDTSLLGREGFVLTALRPSGTIQVDDKRVDAVSDGIFIENKKRVRVTQVHGSRVVVEPVE